MEIFKKVAGYNGKYEISSLGKLLAYPRWIKKRPIILKPLNNRGYFYYALTDPAGNIKFIPAHRLVAIAFIDNPRGVNCVNHKDGNPKNNHFKNLEWCTSAENLKHYRDNIGVLFEDKRKKKGPIKIKKRTSPGGPALSGNIMRDYEERLKRKGIL